MPSKEESQDDCRCSEISDVNINAATKDINSSGK